MSKKYWSSEETTWLIEHYPLYGAAYCAKHLGISSKQITHKLSNLRKHSIEVKFNPVKDNTKICSKCRMVKPTTRYYKCIRGKAGLHAACIDCFNTKDREKFKNDIFFRLSKILRRRFKFIFDELPFSANKEIIIGCSLEEMKIHLEQQFTKEMSWDNYGKGVGKWNIDHIIPVIYLKNNPDKLYLIFNYRNHQPLMDDENNKKTDSMEDAREHLLRKISVFGSDSVYDEMLSLL